MFVERAEVASKIQLLVYIYILVTENYHKTGQYVRTMDETQKFTHTRHPVQQRVGLYEIDQYMPHRKIKNITVRPSELLKVASGQPHESPFRLQE